jgi:hypothetical protein
MGEWKWAPGPRISTPCATVRAWVSGQPCFYISCLVIPTALLGLIRPQAQVWDLRNKIAGSAD